MKNLKKVVGIEAAKYVKSGMIVGLGTGSTAKFFVDELGRRIKEEGLEITTVTTSSVTTAQTELLGIKVLPLDDVSHIDVTVDGVDEFDPQLNGIKGGGASLLMEKIVATYSNDYIWIADESKKVKQLGAFPLPVEVVQFGAGLLFQKFAALGYNPTWRVIEDGSRKITDQKHFIIDLHLGKIDDAYALANELDHTVGVVEHGLFLDQAKTVIIAGKEGIEKFER